MTTFNTLVLQQLATIRANQTQTIIPSLAKLIAKQTEQAIELAALAVQVAAIKAELAPPVTGEFNPPADLMTVVKTEIYMSVMQLEVGQTAVGHLTFDEVTPPADGAVASDNAAVCPITLAADMMTWTAGPALAVGTANFSYTGTSVTPDVGPAVVPMLTTTVIAVPVAEHGDFNPAGAVITGP
jgi:hypothetical protein